MIFFNTASLLQFPRVKHNTSIAIWNQITLKNICCAGIYVKTIMLYRYAMISDFSGSITVNCEALAPQPVGIEHISLIFFPLSPEFDHLEDLKFSRNDSESLKCSMIILIMSLTLFIMSSQCLELYPTSILKSSFIFCQTQCFHNNSDRKFVG